MIVSHGSVGVDEEGNTAVQRIRLEKVGVGVREEYRVEVKKEHLVELARSNIFYVKGGYALRARYLTDSYRSRYLVVELVDLNEKPLVIGYNDMFVALGLSRAFSGSLWRLNVDFEAYLATYFIEPTVFNLVSSYGKTETLYRYLSTVIVAKLLGVNPARIGSEVTIPTLSEIKKANSDWGRALYISLKDEGARRFDILGVLDDGTLVIGEVKNMKNVGGASDLKLEEVAEKVEALEALVEEDPGYVAALIAAFNGGRMGGGGVVRSAFAADPSFVKPKWGTAKFVVALAEERQAVFFVYTVDLERLKDKYYLRSVAEQAYYTYKSLKGEGSDVGSYISSLEEVVSAVASRYSAYSEVVKLLK